MHGAELLLELGGVILGLGILGRVAGRLGLSPIPLYLLAGLAFGKGGLLPLVTATEFIQTGAELGVILLLLLLGIEYSAEELTASLRRSAGAGLVDLALNFTPGLAAGLAAAGGGGARRGHLRVVVGDRRQAARRPWPARQPRDADRAVRPGGGGSRNGCLPSDPGRPAGRRQRAGQGGARRGRAGDRRGRAGGHAALGAQDQPAGVHPQ